MIKHNDEYMKAGEKKKLVWDSQLYKILPEFYQNEGLDKVLMRRGTQKLE
jgi:hypothetical protein